MKAKDLRFGIEIECLVPSELVESGDFRPGPYHQGYRINRSPAGWNSQRDGSLHTRRRGYTPIEVVSPILAGEEGLTEVVYMLAYLNEIGAKVNGSCGLHVHIDATALSPAAINRLRATFQSYEVAFYGINGSKAEKRWNNSYCRPSPRWNGTRHQSLNLTNIGGTKNTAEFRCFFSTLNDYEVVSIVYMCVGLVAEVSEMRNNQVPNMIHIDPAAAAEDVMRYLFNRSNRVVDDETVNDVINTIRRKCQKARRVMLPLFEIAPVARPFVMATA